MKKLLRHINCCPFCGSGTMEWDEDEEIWICCECGREEEGTEDDAEGVGYGDGFQDDEYQSWEL